MFDFHEQERRDLKTNRQELAQNLSDRFKENIRALSDSEMRLDGSYLNYRATVEELKNKFGFNFLLNIWGENEAEDELQLKVQLLNMDTHQRIICEFAVVENFEQESVSDIFYGSFWCEQENWDMFGISHQGIPKDRLLSPEGTKGFPLRKNFQPEPFNLKVTSEYSFSPDPRVPRLEWKERNVVTRDFFSGEVNGPVRAILECYDEDIKRGRLEIGYLHRGIEKILENMTYRQGGPHLSRMNLNSPSFYDLLWNKGIEEHLDIYVPERAKALRMIFNELDRILEHLDTIGWMVDSLGCHPFLHSILEMKEAIKSVLKLFSPGRRGNGLICMGGVVNDTPTGWVTECLNLISYIERATLEISKQISNSTIWMDRLCGYQLSSTQALAWGVTGPNLRASGVNYDLRKVSPHYFYSDVEFEVPLGIKGECYDRYLVRVEEIFQSLSILGQVLDNLPLGDVKSRDSRIYVPRKQDVYRESEALIQHFKVFEKGIQMPLGDFYEGIEAPGGELGIYVRTNGSNYPERVKFRTPSFFSAQCFSDLIENGDMEDVPLVINSLNLVFGEIDR